MHQCCLGSLRAVESRLASRLSTSFGVFRKCPEISLEEDLQFDSIRQSVHRLRMATDKRSTEVDVLQAVLLGLEVGKLSYVVGNLRGGSGKTERAVLGSLA